MQNATRSATPSRAPSPSRPSPRRPGSATRTAPATARRSPGAGPTRVAVGAAVLLLLLLAACGPAAVPDPSPGPLPPTTVPADQDEAARQFVLGFLEARREGDREEAWRFLSPRAREQFAAGEGGLRLVGDFEALALLDLKAADAGSYEAHVRVDLAGGGDVEEYLFVGPGYGEGSGEMEPWVVRGAMVVPGTG